MIDLKISKQVAEEASKEIHKLKDKIKQNKELHQRILQDCLIDLKSQNQFLKKCIIILCVFMFISLMGCISLSIYNGRLIDMLSQTVIQNYKVTLKEEKK